MPPMSRGQDFSSASWRLLHDFDAAGRHHMGRDAHLLAAVVRGLAPPTVCFYSWAPTCLSIGADQPADIVDADACRRLGWHAVRRLTEGRAILHENDLAFTVLLPLSDERSAGDRETALATLQEALLAGLGRLGLNPRRARPFYGDEGASGEAAFDGPDPTDIMMGGRKLIANSAVVHSGILLLQGTLPLYGDTTRVAEALYFDYPGQRAALAARMRYRAANVLLYSGQKVTALAAAEALAAGFAQALNLSFIAESLTPSEQEAAEAKGATALLFE